MLDQVILQTAVPTTLKITDADPNDILIVKSISGLSGAKVTLFTGAYARNGGYYQGRRAEQMNPVFLFKMNHDYAADISISDVREKLYSWFWNPTPGEDGLKVVFKDDRRPDRYLIGFTEDINTDMWQRSQTAQVSMISVDPYLRSVDENVWSSAGGSTAIDIDYEGSAKTGVEIDMKVTTETNRVNARLVVGSYLQEFSVQNPSGNFAVGDVISINTNEGTKWVRRNGVDTLNMMVFDSNWLELRPGSHTLSSNGGVVGDGKAVLTSVKYRAAWWGI